LSEKVSRRGVLNASAPHRSTEPVFGVLKNLLLPIGERNALGLPGNKAIADVAEALGLNLGEMA
jgi:hypothetical protein